MKLKDTSVNIVGLHKAFWVRLFLLDTYWRVKLGYELIITSANDGIHSTDSKHYDGRAVDIRTWASKHNGKQLEGSQRAMVLAKVVAIMGSDFLVIGEEDHIHIQRQKPS